MAGCILGGGTAVNAGLWWNVRDILRALRNAANNWIAQPRGLGLQLPRRLAVD
jgi:hypothetical protein